MEKVQCEAPVMDRKTEVENKTQAVGRVSSRASEPGLSRAESISELCNAKKKTCSPMMSVEIPVRGPVHTAEFMNAAIQGKLDVIERYLADGGNPNVHDELKRTALHRAALEGHTAVVQLLLEKGADISFKDRLGSSASHWACRGGSLGVVKALKNHGADLNIRDERLFNYACPTWIRCVQQIRNCKCKDDWKTTRTMAVDILYSTPLHVATRTGHTAVVEYLLSSGAKINSRDREGDTALHDAVHLNRYKIVKLLIAAGADTKIKNHEGVTAVQQVKQWQFDIMETLQRLEKLKEVGLVPPDNNSREV